MLDKYFTKLSENSSNVKQQAISKKLSVPPIKREECSITDCKICRLEFFIESSWKAMLHDEINSKYFTDIKKSLHSTQIFYPPVEKIFNFTNFSPFEEIKIVIIGQDPYHNPEQAVGLAFSVPMSIRVPPSLQNIYKELASDIPGFNIPKHGDLTLWARQGVLLLNHTLTVAKNNPGSHSGIGWEIFTKKILEMINSSLINVVFLLWGSHARKNASLIDQKKHLVLEAAHPSPFSASMFFGCKHFSKANEYLRAHSKGTVDWNL